MVFMVFVVDVMDLVDLVDLAPGARSGFGGCAAFQVPGSRFRV